MKRDREGRKFCQSVVMQPGYVAGVTDSARGWAGDSGKQRTSRRARGWAGEM